MQNPKKIIFHVKNNLNKNRTFNGFDHLNFTKHTQKPNNKDFHIKKGNLRSPEVSLFVKHTKTCFTRFLVLL